MHTLRIAIFVLVAALQITNGTISVLLAAEYDPLARTTDARPKTVDLTVLDAARDREVPVRVYLPPDPQPAPVVLFSHGLGGSRSGSEYLGRHWSGRGYVAVFLQHVGSDDSIWRDVPLRQRMAALREAASGQNFMLRVRDVPAVLDQLEKWNAEPDHVLAGRLDPQRVGMSGHSFGAVTAQAVSGQAVPLIGQRFTDERIRAAVILSPSPPRRGNPAAAFGSVKVPWLLMTGTKDASPIGDVEAADRQNVYLHLPAGVDHYELVLDRAEHSAFSDRRLAGDREPRNPNHHRAILALSTAFWDAYLQRDDAARVWLQGEGARRVVEAADRWMITVD